MGAGYPSWPKQPKENSQIRWLWIVFVVRGRVTFEVIMIFQISQSTGSQKKRECQLEALFEEDDGTSAMGRDGRWRRISFHPFFCLKLFDFAQTQRTSYSIWIGHPQSLGFYHSRRATYSIDYPQEPFGGINLYLFFLPVSGQKGQISGFCYCAEVWLQLRWYERGSIAS